MKAIVLFVMICIGTSAMAQRLPHGVVYGRNPGTTAIIKAENVESSMGRRSRINATVYGRISQVTKSKGGWFDVDAGHGRVITAHFKTMGINIPESLKNHYVVIGGTIQKQFIADDHQHYAGESDHHGGRTSPKQVLLFEVTGMRVQ